MDPVRSHEIVERLANLLRAEDRRLGQEHGLQPVQVEVLAYLARCNRFSDTPAAVTEYLGVTKGTASQTIQRLREKGFVDAEADPEDGRRLHLSLTGAGKRLLGRVRPPKVWREVAEGLDPTALDGLEQLLRRMLAAQERSGFGICRSCAHHQVDGQGRAHCSLVDEALTVRERDLLCREHTA